MKHSGLLKFDTTQINIQYMRFGNICVCHFRIKDEGIQVLRNVSNYIEICMM